MNPFFDIKRHFIHRNIEIRANESENFVHLLKLTSSNAPTVLRQAFMVDMKFDVVGEDTSSLASFRKLLTVILSGIMAGFGRMSDLRAHLANIFATLLPSLATFYRKFPANYAISTQVLAD